MVSKVAVIALIAVVAVPILLGYAMNIEEVTDTDYKTTGDSVNVTQLLTTGTAYTYANANTYQLNTDFSGTGTQRILPIYETVSYVKSSFPMSQTFYTGAHPIWGGAIGTPLSNWIYLYFQCNYSGSGGYVVGNYCNPDGTSIQTINNLHSFYYDPETLKLTYTYYNGSIFSTGTINVPDDSYRFGLTDTGSFNSDCYAEYILNGTDPDYVDFSAGYHFEGGSNYSIKLPAYTRSALLTMDLSSYTDNSLFMSVVAGPPASTFIIQKSGSHWYVGNNDDWPANKIELYYDSSRSSNTYQIFIQYNLTDGDMTYDYYTRHIEFRYVGDWPTFIGQTNYYQKFTLDNEFSVSAGNVPSMNMIQFATTDGSTPVMRMDDAYFRAFEYPVIADMAYSPGDFRQNPSTTIKDISIYGTSLTFAGNTYTVDKGNITLGGHQIAVNGLTFRSVPNDDLGGYDNLIGDTFISNTAQPGTLTFGGKWSVSVSTIAQESYTVTKMEWVAGHFGWDGIDQNFLLCGLVTCLGAFVGCGIYAKKTRSGGLIPVMIVCGCAAVVFFIML